MPVVGVYRRRFRRPRRATPPRRWVATKTAAGGPVFPAIGDVRTGVQYGPTGADFTGTYTASGGGGSVFGSSVIRVT